MNTISHILKYVSVISNNKEYEIKILWEREQTIRERESKLGWKGATKYLRGRKKLLEEGGVCCKWGNMYFQFISEEEGVFGATSSHVYLRHCVLCSTGTLHHVPTCAYADQKWLCHCSCCNPLRIAVGTTAQCHMLAPRWIVLLSLSQCK